MSTNSSSIRSAVLVAFIVSLLLRFAVAFVALRTFALEAYWLKGFEVVHIAESIVAGRGYSSPFGGVTGPSAWTSPLYTYFVAFIFKVLGTYSLSSAYVLVLMNAVLEASVSAMVCYLGEKYLGTYVGFVAAVVYAVWLDEVFFVLKIWDTAPAALLLAVGFFFYYRLVRESKASDWYCWGIFWGVCVLISPQLMLIFLLFTLAAIRERVTFNRAVVAVLLCVAVITPWTVRNYATLHRLIPIRSNFGYELWLGNHERVAFVNDTSLHTLVTPEEFEAYQTMGEIEYVHSRERMATSFIESNPSRFVRMTLMRTAAFWSEPSPVWLFISVLAFIGAGFCAEENPRETAAYLIAFLVFPLPYLVTHSESWYRHPIDPFLLLMCIYALKRLTQMATSKLTKQEVDLHSPRA